jgi:S1-C subfamily serine protease
MTQTIRTQRLRSPHALLAFLGLSVVGAGAAALSYGQAEAAGETLWREGTGATVVADANFDPRRSLAPLVKEVGPERGQRARGRQVPRVRQDMQGIDPRMLPFLDMDPQPRQGIGSGVILSSDGLVITNHHVVDDADKLEVKLHDGRMFNAKVLGSDPLTDIALIQLEGAKGLKAGDPRLERQHVGRRLGHRHRLADGPRAVRQHRHRLGQGPRQPRPLRQQLHRLPADRRVDRPGLERRPAVQPQRRGHRHQHRRQRRWASGLGFAVPIDQAKQVIPQIKSGGKVVRGWLGISGRDIEPAVGRAPEPGAVIGAVMPGTPAAKAGLQNGDRIVGVDGHDVATFGDLRGRIAELKPGTEANAAGRPQGQARSNLKATVGKLPGDDELRKLGQQGPRGPAGRARAAVPRRQAPPRRRGRARRERPAGPQRPPRLTRRRARPPTRRPPAVDQRRAVRSTDDVSAALGKDNSRVEVKVKRGDATHSAVIERR